MSIWRHAVVVAVPDVRKATAHAICASGRACLRPVLGAQIRLQELEFPGRVDGALRSAMRDVRAEVRAQGEPLLARFRERASVYERSDGRAGKVSQERLNVPMLPLLPMLPQKIESRRPHQVPSVHTAPYTAGSQVMGSVTAYITKRASQCRYFCSQCLQSTSASNSPGPRRANTPRSFD